VKSPRSQGYFVFYYEFRLIYKFKSELDLEVLLNYAILSRYFTMYLLVCSYACRTPFPSAVFYAGHK